MIRLPADDFFATVKANAPDPTLPTPTLRKNFSEFYSEVQEGALAAGDHRVGTVPLPSGATGSWIAVPESDDERVLLFFHGGSFTLGSTADHLGLCVRLARASCSQVFSVDYRLAPEHTFPAPVDDALAAYRYLTTNGFHPRQILPVGISAGGTIVLSLLVTLRDQNLPLPPAAVCMSPITDLLFPGESIQRNRDRDWMTPQRLAGIRKVYLGGRDPGLPLASPVRADLRHLPRLYIQAGTHELLLSDIGTFVEKARWAGVPVQVELFEGMFHAWQIFADDIPEGQEAIDHIGTFAQDILGR